MKRIIVPIVSLVSIGTLISGNVYWKNNINETVQKARQTLQVSAPSADSQSTESSNEKQEKSKTDSNSQTSENQKSAEATSDSESNANQTKPNQSKTADEEDSKAKPDSTSTNDSTESSSDKKESSDSNKQSSNKKPLQEIQKEYSVLFNQLEAQETSKINQLVAAAKADYASKKASKSEIIADYQSTAQQLEANADKSFNIVYQQLQYDLEKNGYSLNEAQTFQRTYNSKKQERAKQIASQITDF